MSSRPSSRGGWAALAALLVLSSCAGTTGTGSPGAGGHAAALPEIEDPLATLAETATALAADPGDADAWFLRARAFEANGQADSAATSLVSLLALEPENVEALVHHGLVLEQLGRPDEALAAYLKATELAPGDPIPWINLGSLQYFHYKRTYEAKTALTRALALDPDNPDAHFNLGVLFADANMFREAQAEWEAVLANAPEGAARNLATENLERIRPLVEEMDAIAAGEADEASGG